MSEQAMNILDDQLLQDIRAHANQTAERECCGMIISHHHRKFYRPVRNVALSNEHFVMHAEDQAAIEDEGEVLAIVHSHPKISPQPSQPDLVGIEKSGLPWVIVNWPNGNFTITYPTGYVAPLIGREFSHGILDCYTLVQDAFKREKGIALRDFPPPDDWWMKGLDLYRDNLPAEGFVEIKDPHIPLTNLLKPWDLILMKVASPVENHAAIYLGDNFILHHVMKRLSSRDPYGGWWRQITRSVWRHRDLMKNGLPS